MGQSAPLVAPATIEGLAAHVATAESIPGWLFPASTAMALFGLALVFWHASTREEYAFVFAGIGWGYLLEQAAIAGYETYSYNVDQFVLVLFDVPLDVAFTWGGILYAGWKTGEALGVSRKRLPYFVGLFALHVDLAIDAVAIRVPFWTWGMDGAWYGVPLNNFWGWWTVAFLFVGCFVALERWIERGELRLLLVPPTALVCFVVAITVYGTLAAIAPITEVLVLVGIVVGSFVVVLTDDLDPRPVPLRIAAVPFLVHGYFLGIGLWLGVFTDHPPLLAVALAMLAISVLLHAVPYLFERRLRGRAAG